MAKVSDWKGRAEGTAATGLQLGYTPPTRPEVAHAVSHHHSTQVLEDACRRLHRVKA